MNEIKRFIQDNLNYINLFNEIYWVEFIWITAY